MPPRPWSQPGGNLQLHWQALPGALAAAGGSEAIFWHLFGSARSGGSSSLGAGGTAAAATEAGAAADTWWLDSATRDRGRFSFMGGRGGSLWRRVEYRLPSLPAAIGVNGAAANGSAGRPRNGATCCEGGPASVQPGVLTLVAADGRRETMRTDFFSWLAELLERQRCCVR